MCSRWGDRDQLGINQPPRLVSLPPHTATISPHVHAVVACRVSSRGVSFEAGRFKNTFDHISRFGRRAGSRCSRLGPRHRLGCMHTSCSSCKLHITCIPDTGRSPKILGRVQETNDHGRHPSSHPEQHPIQDELSQPSKLRITRNNNAAHFFLSLMW